MKKDAFTLAEVLITLGIIGVVAALTIPILVSNHQKGQVLSQLKSDYSIFNSAINMAKVDYGTDMNSWYIPMDTIPHASTYFAQTYFLPYLKTINVCGTSISSECVHNIRYLDDSGSVSISGHPNIYSFTLANGTIVGVYLWTITAENVASCRTQIYFDINGKKAPNILGKDAFLVELGGIVGGGGNKNQFYPYSVSSPRSDLIGSTYDVACNKNTGDGAMCFALIAKDGWIIADDYPW